MEGNWYIRTSDGKTTLDLNPATCLSGYRSVGATHWPNSERAGQAPSGAQHWSGANGGPCNQLVLGVKPRVFPSTRSPELERGVLLLAS